MKRYGYIFDKICDIDNIREAHRCASRGKRKMRVVKAVTDEKLFKIREMLINDTYKVGDYRREIIIDKGKERELFKLPYYPDRIIQWAIMLQCEKIFVNSFSTFSCSSVKGRGLDYAIKLTKKLVNDPKNSYCLKIDVKKFYPSINKEILKQSLLKIFKDPKLLNLIYKIIDSYPNPTGLPIGSYLSQFLANYYLNPLDRFIMAKGFKCVRYMDDVCVFSDNKTTLHALRSDLDGVLKSLKMQMKQNWQIFPLKRGLDFVGYRFFKGYTLLRKRILSRAKKLANKINPNLNAFYAYLGFLAYCNGFRLYLLYFAVHHRIFARYPRFLLKHQ